VVVATTFETEARSKIVSGVTSGEAASKVKRPNARRATSCRAWVTAMEAAGKACAAIASRRIEKAVLN
jgi:hypothetical protein